MGREGVGFLGSCVKRFCQIYSVLTYKLESWVPPLLDRVNGQGLLLVPGCLGVVPRLGLKLKPGGVLRVQSLPSSTMMFVNFNCRLLLLLCALALQGGALP